MKTYIVELNMPDRTCYVQIKYYPKNRSPMVIKENKDLLDEDFLDVTDFKEVQKE